MGRKISKFIFLLLVLVISGCSRFGVSQDEDLRVTPSQLPLETGMPTVVPTPTETIVQGTVSIWHSWEEPYLPALLRRIAEFQAIYPYVQFDVLYVPEIDLQARFEIASNEGYAPTILLGPAQWGPLLYPSGWIAALDDLIDPGFLDNFSRAARGAGEYQGNIIGLPLNVEGVVLYRNQSIVPLAAATMDELIEYAQRGTSGDTVGAVLERSFYYSGGILVGLGGEIMDVSGLPAFNSEYGIAWVNLLHDLEAAGPPAFLTDQDLQLFREGKVGIILDSSRNRDSLSEAIGAENLVIDPWPILDTGSLAGFVEVENVFLSPRAIDEQHQVSWKFVEFLLSTESQLELVEVGLVPALNPSPAIVAANSLRLESDLVLQAMQALAGGVTYPIHPNFELYANRLNIALQSIFEDGADPIQALGQADQAIREDILAATEAATTSP